MSKPKIKVIKCPNNFIIVWKIWKVLYSFRQNWFIQYWNIYWFVVCSKPKSLLKIIKIWILSVYLKINKKNAREETNIIVFHFLLTFWLIILKRIELITLLVLFAVPKEPNLASDIFNWDFIYFVADDNISLEIFRIDFNIYHYTKINTL